MPKGLNFSVHDDNDDDDGDVLLCKYWKRTSDGYLGSYDRAS